MESLITSCRRRLTDKADKLGLDMDYWIVVDSGDGQLLLDVPVPDRYQGIFYVVNPWPYIMDIQFTAIASCVVRVDQLMEFIKAIHFRTDREALEQIIPPGSLLLHLADSKAYDYYIRGRLHEMICEVLGRFGTLDRYLCSSQRTNERPSQHLSLARKASMFYV